MKKIIEASYLTAESAEYYRTILRYFYKQHERMRDYIAPEEVLEYMRSIPEFYDYQEDQLHQQLDQLVKWNNLIARQDMTNAKTIDEYKKKRFRYQCTPYTVEIERMLIQLEKIGDSFQGSLERSQFDRLLQALTTVQEEIDKGLDKPSEDYVRMWEDVLHYFQTIRTSTADYIAYINSEETNQRMQTEAFLVFKSQFTTYLRDFILSLQKTSLQIQQRLSEMPEAALSLFFRKLVQHRLSIPRLEDISTSSEDWLIEYEEYWSSIRQWFLGSPHQQSELERLQWQTNEMIRRMSRYVQRIGERQQNFRSRKKDYLHLAKWFAGTENIGQAHMISSVVFGAMTVQHLYLEEVTTDNMHAETWETAPVKFSIKPRTVHYREKTKPGAFQSNREKKEIQRQRYLEEKLKERQLLEKHFSQGIIKLSELGPVDPFVRKVFLSWIAKSMAAKNHIVRTDYGLTVQVKLDKEKMVTLQAEDGVLRMPETTFVIQEGGNDNGGDKVI
ncbi:MAG: TIGR02677 family protein [Tuberibacillus sp.]